MADSTLQDLPSWGQVSQDDGDYLYVVETNWDPNTQGGEPVKSSVSSLWDYLKARVASLFSLGNAGLVPAPIQSDIDNNYVLEATGDWVPQTGGTGIPGGVATSIQFNNAGTSFGGTADANNGAYINAADNRVGDKGGGNFQICLGPGSTATGGIENTVIGWGANASQNGSVAIGHSADAQVINGIAIGKSAVNRSGGVVIGTNLSGGGGVSIGSGHPTNNGFLVSIGQSHSFGTDSVNSIVIGRNVNLSAGNHYGCCVLGRYLSTTGPGQFIAGSTELTAEIKEVYFGTGPLHTNPVDYTIYGCGNSSTNGDGGSISLRGGQPDGTGTRGQIKLLDLPTSNPGEAGALYDNGDGIVRRSAG